MEKAGGVDAISKKKYLRGMDFGLLVLVVPLAIGAFIWAKDATDQQVPVGEPKTGTFLVFLTAIVILGFIGFLSLGFGGGR